MNVRFRQRLTLMVLVVLVVAQPVTAAITLVYLGFIGAVMYAFVSRRSIQAGLVNRDYSFKVARLMTEMVGALKEITLRDKAGEVADVVRSNRRHTVRARANLSFLSAVLKWGRHARQLDIPERLALEARASLQHRGLETRGREREREPTDEELTRLYALWAGKPRQRIDMDAARGTLATASHFSTSAKVVAVSDTHTMVLCSVRRMVLRLLR